MLLADVVATSDAVAATRARSKKIEILAESLWRLSDAGVWIRIITHRLYVNWGHAVAVADTVAWLDDTGIP